MIYDANYDAGLVIASVLIAIWTSYAAMEVSPRIQFHTGVHRLGWLILTAMCAGGGIWSMHFTAMLAFSLPIPIRYDIPITVLSLVVPILGAMLAFAVVHYQGQPRLPTIAATGIVFGFSIAGMHYTGMAAMDMPAIQVYDWRWVVVSVLIAVVVSTVALYVGFTRPAFATMIAGAVIMGIAISGMHYSAMAGLTCVANGQMDISGGIDIVTLGLSVALMASGILTTGVIVANYDRWSRP